MKKTNEFKEYFFLDNTITISLPKNWLVKNKENNLIKITFPVGAYPILDCYLNCFDNPKINSEEKIENIVLLMQFPKITQKSPSGHSHSTIP